MATIVIDLIMMGYLLFTGQPADDGFAVCYLFSGATDDYHGSGLWKSDGTRNGTSLGKDINPGASWSLPRSLTQVQHTLFFLAGDMFHADQLWKSDGTEYGTVLVKQVSPRGYSGICCGGLTSMAGSLFFAANDSLHGTESPLARDLDLLLGDPPPHPDGGRPITIHA